MTSGTPENVRIEKRRSGLKFEETDDVIHWSNKSVAEQVFLDNFSCYLPLGERFFVDSVRYFEDRIKNKKLKEEVKSFIYQEAQHSLSHHNFNKVLFSKNKLARISELYIQLLVLIARKVYSKRFQLSITAAAEHFTAVISNWLLATADAFLSKNKSDVASMWVWHAIEEIEHKSVAFDVFIEVTPNKYYAYILRVMGMLTISMGLFPAIAINMTMVYLGGRNNRFKTKNDQKVITPAGNIAESRRQPQNLIISKVINESNIAKQKRYSSIKFITLFISKTAKPYFVYYKYSFHPWQHDNSALLNEVKAKFNFYPVVQ